MLQAHEVKLQEVGDSLTDVDARVVTLESLYSDLAQDNARMKLKLEDLENRSRQNNIRVIGVPERAEGARPTAFMETFLLEVFGKESFTRTPVSDRAHRSLAPPPKQNQPLRDCPDAPLPDKGTYSTSVKGEGPTILQRNEGPFLPGF